MEEMERLRRAKKESEGERESGDILGGIVGTH